MRKIVKCCVESVIEENQESRKMNILRKIKIETSIVKKAKLLKQFQALPQKEQTNIKSEYRKENNKIRKEIEAQYESLENCDLKFKESREITKSIKANYALLDENSKNNELSINETTQKHSNGVITVKEESSTKIPHPHQVDAKEKMSEKISSDNKDFAGLLVLPTGGGKTFVAMSWALENIIDKGGKVIWLAHRFELLEQALETLKDSAYKDTLPNTISFNFRVVSGNKIHDKMKNIKSSDDFLIVGKDSINDTLETNFMSQNRDTRILIIIDEAHHSTAKTYREVMKLVKKNSTNTQILGLTATPTRTLKTEKGLLKKVFKDDIIFKVDLDYLISQEILSAPTFEEVSIDANINIKDEEKLAKQIEDKKFLDNLPKEIVNQLINNKERSDNIVNRYLNDKKKYGKYLIFALNIDDAVSLNELFKSKGIKSDVIFSDGIKKYSDLQMTHEKRREIIQRFRGNCKPKDELEVLINVNILTEGTDLPMTKSIFLARPTKSEILMTQMVGRALRGVSAGGTKDAYIVNFNLEWKNKISFVNPEKLYVNSSHSFNDISSDKSTQYKMVSATILRELTNFLKGNVSKYKETFSELLPIGFYMFYVEQNGETVAKEVFVYHHLQENYKEFVSNLETSSEQKLEKVISSYFKQEDKREFGFYNDDIFSIQEYYRVNKKKPQFFKIMEREKYNLTPIAKRIYDEDMGRKTKADTIKALWNDEKNGDIWKMFFNNNYKELCKGIDEEGYRIEALYTKMDDLKESVLTVNSPKEEIAMLQEIQKIEKEFQEIDALKKGK